MECAPTEVGERFYQLRAFLERDPDQEFQAGWMRKEDIQGNYILEYLKIYFRKL